MSMSDYHLSHLSSFKQFLELEPQLRDVLQQFYQSRYTSCLKTLQEMKDGFLLDMYLSNHLDTLYTMVRNKALIQVRINCISSHFQRNVSIMNGIE